ncbi:xylitol dehydrogenase [Colletotrichum tofieldiae]|uniref:Xylitol dehydrogenase n=1 Tax=Colletotrichum tofieldiae TaxID=708197 RepID=A0A166PB24_9PEZI|nr:xylitol dehydrogenase [Colletotrichum tofieldiae]
MCGEAYDCNILVGRNYVPEHPFVSHILGWPLFYSGALLERRRLLAKSHQRKAYHYGPRGNRDHRRVGPAVNSIKVGDNVAIEPGLPCRRCKNCKDGFYSLYPDMKFTADPPDSHGALTKFFVPEGFVYKVPDDVSLQEAVLVEPVAVAVHAARLAETKYGQTVVVTRYGTFGLLCGVVAKAFGARRVILVDILQKKLDFAESFMDYQTFLVDAQSASEDTALAILKDLYVVLEASGARSSIQTGILLLKSGGSYVQVGLGKAKPEISMLSLPEKEVKVRGRFRYESGDRELALLLITDGRVRSAIMAWDK